MVCNLVNKVLDAGFYSATWEGKNNYGQSVSSGMYFYHMKAKGFEKINKAIMVK